MTTSVINPYINFLRSSLELKNKLFWDLTLDSKISRQNVSHYLASDLGDKAVILCNGPSLLKADLSTLDNIFTIGLNKINLLFESTTFRPSCIAACNKHVIRQNQDFYRSTKIPLFLDQQNSRMLNIHATKTRTLLFSSGGYPRFSSDITSAICQGSTVTYFAMQIAYNLGFSKVALIGCDHNFSTNGPAHKTVRSGKVDKDHFDPRYFSNGQAWQLPSIPESEESYLVAKKFFQRDGRVILNCTEGGMLELFDRVSLSEFIHDV